ncbi:sensor histidine kinase [Paenibacillus sp. SI8]|uniref:sensor histidine kinase n=1 Tax=unclassified Paenibacillus TaxID=185978 RepID=UPI0034668793
MRKWFGYSLQRKLSFIMLVTTLIPLLFLGTFAFTTSSDITQDKAQQAGLNSLAQMDAKFKFILKDVENISIFLIGQRDIQSYLKRTDENLDAQAQILGLMTNLVYTKDYISNITLYPSNNTTPLSTSTIYKSGLDQEITIKQITDKLWTGLYHIENYMGDRQVFSFVRPIRGLNTYGTLGWISISVDEQVLSRIWSIPQLADGYGQVALLNERNEIISSTSKGWLSQEADNLFPGLNERIHGHSLGVWTSGLGASQQSILFYREPMLSWTIVGIIPSKLYSAQNRYILQLTAVAVALSVLTNVLLTIFVIRKVTTPLGSLTRLLSTINPDEPLPYYPVYTTDEIGRLAGSYNLLSTHIEVLKKQLIHNETRKKEADMRALQAQINPHFLYNTLSSIHWIALLNEDNRIAEMVGALSDFLRFSLNKGKEYCKVSQELAHIRNYVQVQSIRFPDEFTVDYVVDARLSDSFMLKLLLQPLVENAMIHGIQMKEQPGTISIYVEQKGPMMYFKVMDDGVGMSSERLNEVLDSLYPAEGAIGSDASYGLRNVHERLRLHYGLDSGIKIESRLHEGTCVSFSIPVLEDNHENLDR